MPGLLVHVAAETDDGFLVVDVFESQEAFVDRDCEQQCVRWCRRGSGVGNSAGRGFDDA
jgi:hypothetical protein